jgi:hypothetical protein
MRSKICCMLFVCTSQSCYTSSQRVDKYLINIALTINLLPRNTPISEDSTPSVRGPLGDRNPLLTSELRIPANISDVASSSARCLNGMLMKLDCVKSMNWIESHEVLELKLKFVYLMYLIVLVFRTVWDGYKPEG